MQTVELDYCIYQCEFIIKLVLLTVICLSPQLILPPPRIKLSRFPYYYIFFPFLPFVFISFIFEAISQKTTTSKLWSYSFHSCIFLLINKKEVHVSTILG